MIKHNQLSKYLFYAIGEIILVVIGILIALQINNWNEDRKDQGKEKMLLQQLQVDFMANRDQLLQKIEIREFAIGAVNSLLEYIDSPSIRNQDSINGLIIKATSFTTYDPIIHDLASSGELGLISDVVLKQELTRWTSNIKDVIEDENDWRLYREQVFWPFISEHYQMRNLLTAENLSFLHDNFLFDDNSAIEEVRTLGISKYASDPDALIDHPQFEDHLAKAYQNNSWLNIESYTLLKRIDIILKLIEESLDNNI